MTIWPTTTNVAKRALRPPGKRFRLGVKVVDSRSKAILTVTWMDRAGIAVKAPDGSSADVRWHDAYKVYTVTM